MNRLVDAAGPGDSAPGRPVQGDTTFLLVKIPATTADIPAIRQMIAEGRNINVTRGGRPATHEPSEGAAAG
jgi:transaldolase